MPITVAPTSARARTKWRCVGGKAGSTKTTFTASRVASVHGRRRLRRAVPDAGDRPVRRHGGAAARRPPRGRHHRRRGAGAARPRPASRRALARGRRAGPAADRGRRPRPVGQLGRVERLVGALEQLQVPLAEVRQALGIPGHRRRHRAQRARQVADEDGAARRRDPVRPPPARDLRGRRVRLRRGRRLPARREAARRRRRAGDLPARRRRRPAQLGRGRPAAARGARAAGGVPRRRGTHVRQRPGRRDHGLGVGVGLPAPAAGRAAQPVDPVDGAAAARARRPALRRDPRRRSGRRRGRSGCATG